MKFLIALSVLASSSAFAYDIENRNWIKCYEPAEQGERGDLVYKLKSNGYLKLVHPFHQPLVLNEMTDCLEYPSINPTESLDQPPRLRLCESQGQRINGLVPVDAFMDSEDAETVYCERDILPWFNETPI